MLTEEPVVPSAADEKTAVDDGKSTKKAAGPKKPRNPPLHPPYAQKETKAPAKAKAVAPKAKAVVKPKVAAKPKAVAKPKSKLEEKPAKVAKTSTSMFPRKKAPVTKKAPAKKVVAKSVKPKTVKSPVKKAMAKKGKKSAARRFCNHIHLLILMPYLALSGYVAGGCFFEVPLSRSPFSNDCDDP
ncbi:hypothetical protein Acr_28g0004620 [Actinidia rufa]|uniref:Uncharacterized protein n=1 Tax=Actinidia rufa TaxID=165716 RepID=A0A7J0H9H8_9ERIC|nr:hypothetical protein Acr_28g0004620 [Actinidia rufa]